MEKALELEIENTANLQLEVECLKSKLKQERQDREDASLQVTNPVRKNGEHIY